MDIIKELENEQTAKLAEERPVPDFGPGDTLKVSVKVVEGERERVQAFEGVCIGRKNAGLNSAFTVRKISYGEGVERVFPLYSPAITEIEVVRRGAVRRAKLYYLRGRTGRRARIAEKTDWARKAAAEAAPAEDKAETPKKEAKKKKKKHDVEVPETGEAETVTEDVVAEPAPEAEAQADDKAGKKAKKGKDKGKDKE